MNKTNFSGSMIVRDKAQTAINDTDGIDSIFSWIMVAILHNQRFTEFLHS